MLRKNFAILTMVAMLLSIFPMSVPVAATEATNLILNGSFEELGEYNWPLGYNMWWSAGDVEPVILTPDTPNTETAGENYMDMSAAGSVMAATVGVTPYKNYVFSFWSKLSSDGSGGSIQLTVNFKHNVGGAVGMQYLNEYCDQNSIPYIPGEHSFSYTIIGNDNTWHKNSIEITVPHDTTHVEFSLGDHYYYVNGGAGAKRFIDDFWMVETDFNLVLNGGFDNTASWPLDYPTYTDDLEVVTDWNRLPGLGTPPKFNIMREDNGNQYLFLKKTGGGALGGPYIAQNVRLYEGFYKLNFKRIRFEVPQEVKTIAGGYYFNLTNPHNNGSYALSLPEGWQGASTFGLVNQAPMDERGGDLGQPHPWQNFTVYFTVTQKGWFSLDFGNYFENGYFSIDDVEIVPVTKPEVQYYDSAQVVEMSGLQYGVTRERVDIKYTPEAAITAAGSTVKPMAVFPPQAASSSTLIVTALYKKTGGIDALVKVSTKEAALTTGKIPIFNDLDEIVVPAAAVNEEYYVKTFLWNSFGGMIPANSPVEFR